MAAAQKRQKILMIPLGVHVGMLGFVPRTCGIDGQHSAATRGPDLWFRFQGILRI